MSESTNILLIRNYFDPVPWRNRRELLTTIWGYAVKIDDRLPLGVVTYTCYDCDTVYEFSIEEVDDE